MTVSTVRLSHRASRLASKGHPWFFADDLAANDAEHGTLVRVVDAKGRDLGIGFHSKRSRIRLRLCGRWEGDGVPDAGEFFAERLGQAVERRKRLGLLEARSGARLVHADADGLPGLVVDRYADALVLQVTSAFVESCYDCMVPYLVEKTGADSVWARNDVVHRDREGLPREVRLVQGRRKEIVEIEEHGVVHEIDLLGGHKTGFYLDQRLARSRIMELSRDRSVLDLFSYQGAFALAALSGGATGAIAVDQSREALQRACESASRNDLDGLETERANAFDRLREFRKEERTFDLIVVDPPPFARRRSERSGALRGYRDLNRNALRLLAPGGHLLACSCSHHVSLPMFEAVLRQGAAGLPFPVSLVDRIPAGSDHPVWLSLPESEYLKAVLLQRIG